MPVPFQSYMTNIEAKTGISSDGFKKLAEKAGFMKDGKMKPEVKATQIFNWLKAEYGLGHGHCQAMWASLNGKTE